MSDGVRVVYRVRSSAAEIVERAESLLLEQTVELPRRALHTDFVKQQIVGTMLSIEPVAETDFRVTLSQPVLATGCDPAQLLNVLFGNSSLQPDVVLEDVLLPAEVGGWGRPQFGILGIRAGLGVHERALTASALKPMGLSVEEAAALCGTFARSGIDLIKDDHGLADHVFCPFVARVQACLQATREAEQVTGRRSWYVPNLVGSPATVLRQAEQAQSLGAPALMVSPMLLGLPFLAELAAQVEVPLLAHPAFGGAQRVAPAALLGTLFPRYGADAVIFPNFGGRFSYSRDECGAIAQRLRHPPAGIAPTFPVPAGGMKTENVPAVLDFFGVDTILLIGGSLLEAPTTTVLEQRSRAFVEAVRTFPYHP